MNIDKAFPVESGIDIYEENAGNIVEGPFITGGPNSPDGLNLPERTLYVQNTVTGFTLWKKFGNGINDWRIMDGRDLPFDPTGLPNFDGTDISLKLALERYGASTFETRNDYERITKISVTPEQTASNIFETYLLQLSTTTFRAGKYNIDFTADISQSKANRVAGTRYRWRPEGGVFEVLTYSNDGVAIANAWDNRMFSKEITLPTDSKIEVFTEYGFTTGGGIMSIRESSFKIYRTGDL